MGSKMTVTPADAIDFVYTWVDGEKNADLRAHYAAQAALDADDKNARRLNDMSDHNRFRDNREIVQSIESVRRFAPFVRKIFIVAAEGQVPDWYTPSDYPEVEMVFHPQLFGEAYSDMLPTFNSHTIEAMLPFISGLSERFVYFNDDMLLGAKVTPADFYDADGTAIVRVHHKVADFWQTHKKPWRVYRGNMFAALQQRFPGTTVYDTAHQARTLLKSACISAWHDPLWKELLILTARDKFRDLSNIPPIELFSNLMLIEKKARAVSEHGLVLHLFDRTVFGPEFDALKNVQPKFYCINDDTRAPSARQLEKFQYYLSHQLPHHLNLDDSPSARCRPARPRLGAVQHELAHAISWLNRIWGKLLGLFSHGSA